MKTDSATAKAKKDTTLTKTKKATTKKAKKVEYTTTKSGLKYTDFVVGKGDEAVNNKTVEVHYTGWLMEKGKKGTKFDSSYDRGKPISFVLGSGRVIKGWEEGILGMKVGGKRELIIPPTLGYGASGAGGVIPPNATLIFDVELVKVL
ncbi:MAG: FKBP-type peptidyl-prolyl cis-trans isomerase [FCB group bacterium]|nr:FKBP-type peptidyl-prolyl cis-trans isomerase [FCB group bacterium]